MKTIFTLICAMFMTCATLVNAQNETQKFFISGTLVNPAASVEEYEIEVRETGKDNRLLEVVKPEANGYFQITVVSDRSVRLVVKDKSKDIVFRRTLVATPDNNKMDLKQIDLSKTKTDK